MEYQRINPYVGWRPFEEDDSSLFYGREREADDLTSLVPSQHLVLLSAPSGAGKTSLINARLVPALSKHGFATLPIGRVGGSPEPLSESGANVFVDNLILRLDANQHQPDELRSLSLSQYIMKFWRSEAKKKGVEDAPLLLIIDQFEEIVTTNQEHWRQRDDFFLQLRQALKDDPNLWVLISIRDDYVEALSPYSHLLPNQLRTRYYLERLTYDAALEAVKGPADSDLAEQKMGGRRPFAPGVAEKLVDELRRIRVSGQDSDELGEFVEPLQLQIVCYQIWEKVQLTEPGEITREDLQEFDAQQALVQAYERMINEVIAQTGVSETKIRTWFEEELITDEGTRSFVFRGAQTSGKLDNEVVDVLNAKWLIRRSERAGGSWYELVHDSFISPILRSNQNWRMEQPLLQLAERWQRTGRPVEMLYNDTQLRSLDPGWKSLGPVVLEYIECSRAEQESRKKEQAQADLAHAQALADAQAQRARAEQARADAERDKATQQTHARRRIAALAAALAVALIIAVGMAAAAGYAWNNAENARQFARHALAGQLANRAASEHDTSPLISLLLIAETAHILDDLQPDVESPPEKRYQLLKQLHHVLQWSDSIPWQAHEGEVLDIAFDPQSNQIYTAGAEGSITKWDIGGLDSGLDARPVMHSMLTQMENTEDGFIDVTFDRFGRQAVFQKTDLSSYYMRLNEIRPLQRRLRLDNSQLWRFAFSPDGSLLAAGSDTGVIKIIPLHMGLPDERFYPERIMADAVTVLAFSPDNQWLTAGGESNEVYFWRLSNRQTKPTASAKLLDYGIDAITFAGGNSVLIVAGDSGTPSMLELPAPEPSLRRSGHSARVSESPRQSTEPVEYITRLAGADRIIESLDVDQSGRWLTVAGEGIWRWDLHDAPTVIDPLPAYAHKEIVSLVRSSIDGHWLLSADRQGWVRLWDLNTLPNSANQQPDINYSFAELQLRACRAAGPQALEEDLTGVLLDQDAVSICAN